MKGMVHVASAKTHILAKILGRFVLCQILITRWNLSLTSAACSSRRKHDAPTNTCDSASAGCAEAKVAYRIGRTDISHL